MNKKACFIGHRKINITQKLKNEITIIVKRLIAEGFTDFIFGDHSQFDALCYETVSELKTEYPYIRRIKYRCDYPEISEETKSYFFTGYEDNIFPKEVLNAGKAKYIKRNMAMIRASDICVFYFNTNYSLPVHQNKLIPLPAKEKRSGTRQAYDFALTQNKTVINMAIPRE